MEVLYLFFLMIDRLAIASYHIIRTVEQLFN
jgi:hypothetical protein